MNDDRALVWLQRIYWTVGVAFAMVAIWQALDPWMRSRIAAEARAIVEAPPPPEELAPAHPRDVAAMMDDIRRITREGS